MIMFFTNGHKSSDRSPEIQDSSWCYTIQINFGANSKEDKLKIMMHAHFLGPHLLRIIAETNKFSLKINWLNTDKTTAWVCLHHLTAFSVLFYFYTLSFGTRCMNSAARCSTGHSNLGGRTWRQLQPRNKNKAFIFLKWIVLFICTFSFILGSFFPAQAHRYKHHLFAFLLSFHGIIIFSNVPPLI